MKDSEKSQFQGVKGASEALSLPLPDMTELPVFHDIPPQPEAKPKEEGAKRKLSRKKIKESQDFISIIAPDAIAEAYKDQAALNSMSQMVAYIKHCLEHGHTEKVEEIRKSLKEKIFDPYLPLMKEQLEGEQKALQGIQNGDPESLFSYLSLDGPRILGVKDVLDELERWWLKKTQRGPEGKQAKERLKRIGESLSYISSGRDSLSLEKEKEIREIYRKQLQFCQKFKKALLACPSNNKTVQNQQLANQFNMSGEEIATAREESFQLKPSEWARKRTAKQVDISEETVRQVVLKKK
jgi:DNA-binding transcriptional regulator YiaG